VELVLTCAGASQLNDQDFVLGMKTTRRGNGQSRRSACGRLRQGGLDRIHFVSVTDRDRPVRTGAREIAGYRLRWSDAGTFEPWPCCGQTRRPAEQFVKDVDLEAEPQQAIGDHEPADAAKDDFHQLDDRRFGSPLTARPSKRGFLTRRSNAGNNRHGQRRNRRFRNACRRRWGDDRRFRHRGSQTRIIFSLRVCIQQAYPGGRDFCEEPMRKVRVRTSLVRAHVARLPKGRRIDHVRVGLEQFQPQQPVVVRWLVLGPNPEPAVIGIK